LIVQRIAAATAHPLVHSLRLTLADDALNREKSSMVFNDDEQAALG
jgi:hypothetical protein